MDNKYHYFKENGAKVAVWPVRNVETVVCQVSINAGFYFCDLPSFPHLLEHLTTQSTKNFPTYKEIEEYKEHYGIRKNANAGGSVLRYRFEFPKKYVKEGFKLIEEIIFKPVFKQELIDKEISVLEQEARDFWNNPYNRFEDQLIKNLAGKDHIYCRTAFGQIKKLSQVTLKDLVDWHKKFYFPSNTSWVISGDVKLEKVKENLSQILDRPNYSKQKIKSVPPEPNKRVLIHQDSVDQPYLTFNWFIPERKKLTYKEFLTFDDISYILVSNRRSLLYSRLREDLGLIYNVGAKTYHAPGFSILQIRTSTQRDNIPKVCFELKKIVSEFSKSGISEDKYNKLKHYRDLRTLMAFDSIKDITSILTAQLKYPGEAQSAEEINEIAKGIKVKEVKSLTKKYLVWDKVYLGLMAKDVEKINSDQILK